MPSPWIASIPLDFVMVAEGRFDPFLADVHHPRVLQQCRKTNGAPMDYRWHGTELDATIERDKCADVEVVSKGLKAPQWTRLLPE